MYYKDFKKSDPAVAHLVRLGCPNYRRRRKVKVMSRERYTVKDYWDGGSRDYAEFVDLRTQRIMDLKSLDYEHQSAGNPFNLPIGTVNLKPGLVVVEHVIFCGKDLGVRIYMHPEDYERI